MSIKKSKIEHLIHEFLLDEGLLREKISDPDSKLDFGLIFSFPPGPKGQRMSVFKLKNRAFIIISIQTQFSKSHINALNSLKDNKKSQFFIDLRKYFLHKEVFFRIDDKNYKYEINDQIFITNDGLISKNSFFKRIRKIFYCFITSNMILGEYCMGKEISSKNLGSNFDFSLYS